MNTKHNNACMNMAARLCVCLALMVASVSVYADDEELDSTWQEIVIGENTFAAGISWHYFYYDATSDGTLVLTGSANPGSAYLDQDISESAGSSVSYVSGVKVSSTVVTAGTRYYFKASGISTSTDYTFTAELQGEDTEITLSSVSPDEYSAVSITGSGLITLTFNMGVSYDDATLSVNDASESVSGSSSSKMIISLEIADVVYEWLTDGTAVEGDTLTLTITGICSTDDDSKIYGDDGTLTLHFLTPSLPLTLEEETLPETFLSYWEEGDEDGIIILTFSDSVYAGTDATYTGGARLSFGNVGDEDYYAEEVGITVDGNKVIIDCTGKSRTLETMGASSLYVLDSYGDETDELRTMNLKVYNICDVDGNAAYSETQGNVGSFSYSFDYELLTANVSWEFTPEDGSSLSSTDYLELAVTGYDAMSYSGVEFDYTYQGEAKTDTVSVDDVIVETDALVEEFTYLEIPVSDEIQNSVDITVTLLDVTYSDGVSRDDITAQYDFVNFTLVSPTDSSEVAIVGPDSCITVSTDIDSRIGCLCLTITDITASDSVIVSQSAMTYDEDNSVWNSALESDYCLDLDHEFLLTFDIYSESEYSEGLTPLASATATLFGTSTVETGISNVTVNKEGSCGDVYTLDGKHVMKASDNADINSLPAGIYIMNGNKVVVK